MTAQKVEFTCFISTLKTGTKFTVNSEGKLKIVGLSKSKLEVTIDARLLNLQGTKEEILEALKHLGLVYTLKQPFFNGLLRLLEGSEVYLYDSEYDGFYKVLSSEGVTSARLLIPSKFLEKV